MKKLQTYFSGQINDYFLYLSFIPIFCKIIGIIFLTRFCLVSVGLREPLTVAFWGEKADLKPPSSITAT